MEIPGSACSGVSVLDFGLLGLPGKWFPRLISLASGASEVFNNVSGGE